MKRILARLAVAGLLPVVGLVLSAHTKRSSHEIVERIEEPARQVKRQKQGLVRACRSWRVMAVGMLYCVSASRKRREQMDSEK